MRSTARSSQLMSDGDFRLARRNRTGSAISTATITHSRARRVSVMVRGSVDGHFLEELELVERLAGAEHDGELRILRDHDRQAGLLAQEHVEVLELRAAAREHDAAVDDVGGELGRRALEDD